METLALVCWIVLSSDTEVCSVPMPQHEAMSIYRSGAREGTSAPSVYREGSEGYAEREVEVCYGADIVRLAHDLWQDRRVREHFDTTDPDRSFDMRNETCGQIQLVGQLVETDYSYWLDDQPFGDWLDGIARAADVHSLRLYAALYDHAQHQE